MTTLICTPDRNTHAKDYENAFRPDAQALEHDRSDAQVLRIDLGKPKAARQRQLIAAIEQYQPETWAWFGHGLQTSLPQLGIDTPAEIAVLAAALAACGTAPRVVLYACSTGGGGQGGDGHFADQLRDAIVKCGAAGVQVDAHDRAGDTSRNPFVRRFQGPEAKPEKVGGYYLVQPGGLYWARWRCCDDHTSQYCPRRGVHGMLRLEFPWLTAEELQAAIEAESVR